MIDTPPKRNPDWQAAELLLALNTYFELKHTGVKATDQHPVVIETSQLLNNLSIHPHEKRNAKFRDPAGVRRRFRYFARLEAGDEIKGRAEYRAVWNRYKDDLEQLRIDAADVANGVLVAAQELEPDQYEALGRDLQAILDDPDLDATERDALVKARKGQGRFRKELLKLWQGCALSGCKNQTLLVASHIKPWAKASNRERLDPYNGLLLNPTWDRLFDLGLITFTDQGGVVFSPYLDTDDRQLLGVSAETAVDLDGRHLPYIRYHRKTVFKA